MEREKEDRKALKLSFNSPLPLTTGTLLNFLIASSFHFSNGGNATKPGSFFLTHNKLSCRDAEACSEERGLTKAASQGDRRTPDPLPRRQGACGIYGIRKNAAKQSKVWGEPLIN